MMIDDFNKKKEGRTDFNLPGTVGPDGDPVLDDKDAPSWMKNAQDPLGLGLLRPSIRNS